MEVAASTEEVIIFGKVDNNGNAAPDNEVIRTSRDILGWASNNSLKVSRLVTTGAPGTTSIGPNTLLKVMAGDVVNAYTRYFYEMPTSSSQITNTGILSSIATSIIGGLTGSRVGQAVKDGAGSLEASLQDVNASPLIPYLNNRPGQQADRPKAYLNYIFFDENFNYVENESGAVPVDKDHNDYQLVSPQLRAPKNGYVYVYLSNESDWAVQFDDFMVSHERGAIIEETHYYPYGMKIAGISARAFNKLPNKYNFQGDYSEDEEESGYNDFDLRTYDAQIGRWIQQDPYDEFASGYLGMGNDPVNSVDEDGGLSIPYLATMTIMGGVTGYSSASKGEKFKGMMIGAGIGLGVGVISNMILNNVFNYYVDGGSQGSQFRSKDYDLGWEKYDGRGFDAFFEDGIKTLFSSNTYFWGVSTPKYSWKTFVTEVIDTRKVSEFIEKAALTGGVIAERVYEFSKDYTEGSKVQFRVTGGRKDEHISISRDNKLLSSGPPSKDFTPSFRTRFTFNLDPVFRIVYKVKNHYPKGVDKNSVGKHGDLDGVTVLPNIQIWAKVKIRNSRVKITRK